MSAPLFLLIPLFKTVPGLAAIIWLQSLISESFRPANSVAITMYAGHQNITRAFSLNRMAINLGFSIGPALGGILSAISYNLLFFANSFGALLAGIMYVYFFGKRHKKVPAEPVKENMSLHKHRDKSLSPYRDRLFIVFCIICTLFAIFFFQFFNTIPIFYKDVAHLNKSSIGFILGYSGFLIVLLEMLMVNIAQKRWSIAQTLFCGTVTVALSYSMLALSHHLVMLLLSITMLSLGEILALPFISTLTALRAGKNNTGAYMGLNGMAFSVSFIITPFLGTTIASDFGFDRLWILSGAVLFFAAGGFYILVKKMQIHITPGH